MKQESPISTFGQSEDALDRRERLLAARKNSNPTPLEEKLRIMRENEYPIRRRNSIKL